MAAVAESRSNGAADLPATVRSEPRKRLREAATITLCPRTNNWSRFFRSSQFWFSFLENPIPGSTMICSGATPAAYSLSRTPLSSATTSSVTLL
ncbi:hypothetical protein PJL18_04448 [Paenarthrobacter nicotinovorans]|nr:hypothetical protein [Paenarthrobacter nicotinovorans]